MIESDAAGVRRIARAGDAIGGKHRKNRPEKKKSRRFLDGFFLLYGAPGRIRTSDPQVRSLVLYPTELRAREAETKLCQPRWDWSIPFAYPGDIFRFRSAVRRKRDPDEPDRMRAHGNATVAESEGFEPSMELLTPYSLSRGAPSASRATLRRQQRSRCCAGRITTQSPWGKPEFGPWPSPRWMRW